MKNTFRTIAILFFTASIAASIIGCNQPKLSNGTKAVITKITVNGTSKESTNIMPLMTFPEVKADCETVKVEVVTNPKDARVSFANNQATNNKTYTWRLTEGENSLRIFVGGG